MNILITAGGTSERIDDVRAITNTSTGRLGREIGQKFLELYGDKIDTLYYLHGLRAQPAEGPKVKAIPVEGAEDLERAMTELLTAQKIDAVIHAMAVSDYTVREVTTLEGLRSGETAEAISGNKISSNIDDLVVLLKRSPKVIGKMKQLSPASVLVGFKLLSGVPREELIQVGHQLLQKNNCTYVLANDLKEISATAHRGYLIHRDGTYDVMENNAAIAEMICQRVIAAVGKEAV